MEFVYSIAETVLGRLTSYASQEVSLAWGANLELTKLNKTLSAIKLVLEDAEKKQVRNPPITRWLGNLKDVCHDVDDVLDELEFQKLWLKVEVDNCGKIKGKVRQFFPPWNPVVFNFKMGHKVKEIRERLVFKTHDLIHDLAISVAQVEYSTVNFRPSSALEMIRHVSISKKDLIGEDAQVPEFMLNSKKLRTIIVLEEGMMSECFVKTCISRFKCMRVLDLSGSPLGELPNSIGSLFHLRFLNLSDNRKIKRLPNSISKMLNLETLSFWGCEALEEIPKDIGNLINLRSLEITTQQTYLPKGIRRLTLLQYLDFEGCVDLKSLGEEVQFLDNLRKLMISRCNNLECLPPNMKHMTALDTLGVNDCDAERMAAQFEQQLDRAKGGKRKVTNRQETARCPIGTCLTFPERESRQKQDSSLYHEL